MVSVLPVVLGVISGPPETLPLRPQTASLGVGQAGLAGVVTQYLAVAVVVIAALLIARLHRKVMAQCQHLQGQMSRAAEGQTKLQMLLADLMATLNFSLASRGTGPDDLEEQELDAIRAAVQQATEGASTVRVAER
jgi:hypothetical protein